MVLILFGTGGICQVVLGGSTKVVSAPKGDFLSLNTGWAVGKLHPSLAILPVMADAGAICRRRCGRRVDFRRHIWWTYQPCRALFSQLRFVARATSLCRPCSFVSGRILAGDNLCGAVPEIPMEESTSVHSWPTHGRILWKPVCLCQLLPRDRPVRGWERRSHSSRHCVTIRLICCKFEEELVKLILMNAFNCPI